MNHATHQSGAWSRSAPRLAPPCNDSADPVVRAPRAADHDGMTRHAARRLRASLAWLICLPLATGCLGTSARGLPGHEVLGGATTSPLILDAATATHAVQVTRSAARRAVGHPFAAPELSSGLEQFGLARVTATGLAWEGTGAQPVYDRRLAWIGVYEISKSGDHSCPRAPQSPPSDLPPVFAHYYFAVLVDAQTGEQATWNEDMTGLLTRQCAGLPTG